MTKTRLIALVSLLFVTILIATGAFFYFKHQKDRAERRFAGELFLFGLAYHDYADEHGIGPKNLDDLDWELKEQFPTVCELIKKSDLQVVWEARFRGGVDVLGELLLAYENGGESRISWGLTASGSPVRIAPENYKMWQKIGPANAKKQEKE